MPFNGSGVYTPPAADFPVVTNTVISSTHFNNTINDIATGLTTCLTKDGQTTPTANIKLGGFKLTGVGAPSTTNDALTFGTAGTMTTLTAATSVVTPLVVAAAAATLRLGSNNAASWQFNATGPNRFEPIGDNTDELGNAAARIAKVFTPIIDSGTTGSLSLKTNNGSTQFSVSHTGGTIVNNWSATGSITGARPFLFVQGTDANITGGIEGNKGTGTFQILDGSTGAVQFEFLSVPAGTRWITSASSNGGNPTISTTAGSLAITPVVTMASTLTVAGTTIQVGTNPASSGALATPYQVGLLQARDADNASNIGIISTTTINSIKNVVGLGTSGVSAGVIIGARIVAGAPSTSDLPVGQWMLWRDTSGATTKLYYNNAGALQSVALA